MLNATLKFLSLQYPSIHPSPQIVQQEIAHEKKSELLDLSFFRYLKYKILFSNVMLLANLFLCMQNQNFCSLHFVVVYKSHVQQECYEYH